MSNRLTGGPAAAGCLDKGQGEAMGEGWSDPADARGIGSFVLGQPLTGTGLRNYPHSSDLAINLPTFEEISDEETDFPHGAGEVWASALLDMYWNLVSDHGFDPDVRLGSGGNNIALELVMDALKLQPCDPNYLEARDAILQVDLVSNESANTCGDLGSVRETRHGRRGRVSQWLRGERRHRRFFGSADLCAGVSVLADLVVAALTLTAVRRNRWGAKLSR